jgi:hypothetical protein
MKEEKIKIIAWEKAMKRFMKKHKGNPNVPTLGQLFGGCPNCGHACSFDTEKFHCYKCGWDYKDELKKVSKHG